MSGDDIRTRLTTVFRRVFEHVDALRDDMKPGDVAGWDSVAHVTLVMATEREFKIKFKGGDIANVVSVGDMIKYIQAKVP